MDKLTHWRWGDTLLVIAVAVAALELWAVLSLCAQTGSTVTVTVDNEPFATLPLSQDATMEIAGIGGTNTLEIADGTVRITAADCPDGICVHHRAICRAGESIICLPHRVTVTVMGGSAAVDGEV